MNFLSRLIAALAYAGAAFLFGMALGERGELGPVQHVFTAVIPVATIVLAFLAKRNRAHVFATGLAMVTGLMLGQKQFADAWQDCLVRGESVRVALLRREDYPNRLEELPIVLPCRCGLRKTILHYHANERGFRVWMTNDRETWAGTDRQPFTPSERSSGR